MKYDPADATFSNTVSTLGQFCAVFKGFIQPPTSGLFSFKVSGLSLAAPSLNSFSFRFNGFVVYEVSIANPNSVFSRSLNDALVYELSMEFCAHSLISSSFEIQWQQPTSASFVAVDANVLHTNGTILKASHVNVLPSFPEYFYPSSSFLTRITSGVPATFSISSLDRFGNSPNSCIDEDFLVLLVRNPRFSSRNVMCSVVIDTFSQKTCDVVATCTPSLLAASRDLDHDWKLKAVTTRELGLWATYYSSTSLTSPVATRLVPSIDFSGASLGSQPVASLASGAGWSVRWAGFVRAPVAGGATWTFFIGLAAGGNGGNGVRGWVDGVAVVNGWSGVAGGGEVSGTVVLSGASNSYYEVVVEYKAVGGAYGCTLSLSESSVSRQVASNLVSGGKFSFTEHPMRAISSKGEM
jgi:hypothetical protein